MAETAVIDRLADPKVNLLRYDQRLAMQDEKAALQEQIAQPVLGNKSGIENKGAMRREIQKIDKQLLSQGPPMMDTATRDVLAQRERVLRDEILQGMPTQEEMRRNPPGAVHKHMSWEKANKQKILTWKNYRIALEPDSQDPDLANLERYRPSGMQDTSTFMVNAQIPGHFAMSPQAKANWPVELPPQGTANSALAQVQAREQTPAEHDERQEPMQQAKAQPVKTPMSPEKRETFKRRMAEARAKKQAAAQEAA